MKNSFAHIMSVGVLNIQLGDLRLVTFLPQVINTLRKSFLPIMMVHRVKLRIIVEGWTMIDDDTMISKC